MRGSAVLRRLRLPVLAASAVALVVAGLASSPGTAAATPGSSCTEYSVPVALTENGPEDYTIVGDLCLPDGETTTIQLLVHGGTYNRSYWDFPYQSQLYSYVDMANQMGYATFAVGNLGVGESSRPVNTLVDVNTAAKAMHDVITKLRAGSVNSVAYDKVIYVGHSLGVGTGWVEASLYNDIDAFIATGTVHAISQTGIAPIFGATIPASQDPKFAALNLDSGYLSTPGVTPRGTLFYHAATSSPQVVQVDADNRDTMSQSYQLSIIPVVLQPAQGATSQALTVPVLSVIGQFDALLCGADALDCSDLPAGDPV